MSLEQQVNWPAILVLAGDAELTYFADYLAWSEDPDLNAMLFAEGDKLIDVTGQAIPLNEPGTQVNKMQISKVYVSVDELVEHIRAHQSQLGDCCVAKITIKNYAQGFELLNPDA